MISGAMAVAPASVTGVDLVAREARFPRLVALILDTIFVSLLTLVATNVYGVTVVTWGSPIAANGFAAWGAETTIPWIWTVAIWLGYYIVCEAMFGATPGKAMNGLVVVSADGRRLTAGAIVVRNLVRFVDALPVAYLLGGFFVLSNAQSQRIGDLAAHTTVVLRRRVIDREITRSSGRTARLILLAVLAALVAFTALFDYFERPALIIQGDYNQRQLGNPDIVAYSLGAPTRTLGTVTYPITARTATTTCTGTVTLYWEGLFGWQMSGDQLLCTPS
jgi:uncharacterized RDD family membrane protein YckC